MVEINEWLCLQKALEPYIGKDVKLNLITLIM